MKLNRDKRSCAGYTTGISMYGSSLLPHPHEHCLLFSALPSIAILGWLVSSPPDMHLLCIHMIPLIHCNLLLGFSTADRPLGSKAERGLPAACMDRPKCTRCQTRLCDARAYFWLSNSTVETWRGHRGHQAPLHMYIQRGGLHTPLICSCFEALVTVIATPFDKQMRGDTKH